MKIVIIFLPSIGLFRPCLGLQDRLLAKAGEIPRDIQANVDDLIADPEVVVVCSTETKPCKDCCPRPKATVTITETYFSTEICTHTRSFTRTQLTTVRFTDTVSSVVTRTNKINFTNTTTVVGSRQVTSYHTIFAIKQNTFTVTTTIFTSFQLATVISTTRLPSTRTVSTLVIGETTTTERTTLTLQTIITEVTTSTTTFDLTTNVVVTINSAEPSTVSEAILSGIVTVLQDTPYTIASTWSSTQSYLFTNFFLDNLKTGSYTSTLYTLTRSETPFVTRTFTRSIYTNDIASIFSVTTTITFSKLYPPQFV